MVATTWRTLTWRARRAWASWLAATLALAAGCAESGASERIAPSSVREGGQDASFESASDAAVPRTSGRDADDAGAPTSPRGGRDAPAGGAGAQATAGHGGARAGSGAGAGAGSGGSGGSEAGVGAGSGGAGSGSADGPLAARYPGDVGIEADQAVVFVENFEGGSVDAITARYEDFKNPAGMALEADVPAGSSGSASLRLRAGGSGADATDLYKRLDPGYDDLYMRWYVKYQSGVDWAHTGVWIGGYNPPMAWPSPQAGLRPNGDDRFSVSFEPMEDGANPRMDFYNYWMKMRSWMDIPSGNTAYYGNTLLHDSSVRARDGWMCIEVHVRLNPDPGSGAGAELGLWIDDDVIMEFTDQGPLGYWVKDKFCPEDADNATCTDYPPAAGTQFVPLDLQYRSTTALKLNAFWPQNYITGATEGSVWYDDMVLATERIGCLR